MTILKQLWAFLAVLGPAPAGKPVESGPPSLEPAERGMFDAPEGEEDAGEPRADAGEEQEEQEEQDDGADENDGREAPRAEDDEDEDDDEQGEETEDGEGEEAEDEDDDTALTLQRSWETRLEAEARSGNDGPPRLRLGEAKVRENARKKFLELQEKGDSDPDAIFEIAMDAALQVVGAYHDDVASPTVDRVDKSLRNVQVGRSLSQFRKAVGANLTPAIETKMAAKYRDLAGKYGWKRADTVPLKDLFRMAGGRMGKGAKAPKAPAAPEDAAREQKKQALGAASGPRAIGRTRPEGGAGPSRKEDRALREFSEDVRGSKPFFQFS